MVFILRIYLAHRNMISNESNLIVYSGQHRKDIKKTKTIPKWCEIFVNFLNTNFYDLWQGLLSRLSIPANSPCELPFVTGIHRFIEGTMINAVLSITISVRPISYVTIITCTIIYIYIVYDISAYRISPTCHLISSQADPEKHRHRQ